MRIGATSTAEARAAGSERQPSRSGTARSGDADAPVGAGDRVPRVEIVASDGRRLDLEALVSSTPTVLVVRPRGWSPLVDARLAGLWQIGRALAELGYQILVVGADGERTDDVSSATRAPRRRSREAAGVLASQGLPMPAVFVIGRGGRITFAHWNPDYRERLEPEKVLEAARAARSAEEDDQPAPIRQRTGVSGR